jgi:hypothetical protein
MSSTPQPAAIVVAAVGALLPLVLLGWPSVSAWRRLARTYPDRVFPVEKSYRSVGGQIGGVYLDFGNLLRVDIGSAGLRLSLPRIFQRWLPPFFVPWSEITACGKVRYYFVIRPLKLDFARWPAPVHLYSRLWRNETLAEVIQKRWEEHRSQAPTAAGREGVVASTGAAHRSFPN